MIHTLFFVAFFLCGQVQQNRAFPLEEEKIVGGTDVSGTSFSWEVSIGLLQDVPATENEQKQQAPNIKLKSPICGGILLTKNWVLTAGSCVSVAQSSQARPANELGVGIDSKNLIEMYDQGRLLITDIHIHLAFDVNNIVSGYNIALLKLSDPSPSMNPNLLATLACLGQTKSFAACAVKPACLSTTTPSTDYPGLTAIGWGLTTPRVYDHPTGKWNNPSRSATLKRINLKDTSSTYEYCQKGPKLLCTFPVKPDQGPCQYDTGDSLVLNDNTVVGLLSFLPPDHRGTTYTYCTKYAGYTRLSEKIDWIKSNVKDPFCQK